MSKRKKYTLKEPQIDNRLIDERGPTAERMRGVDYEVGDTGILRVNQSPIERAIARGDINRQQGEAARNLYRVWYNAQMLGSTGSADPLKIFGTTPDYTRFCATEWAETNWQILVRALGAIRKKMDGAGQGMDAVKLLDLVVFQEIPFTQAGFKVFSVKSPSQAAALAKHVIQKALRVLVFEWGY